MCSRWWNYLFLFILLLQFCYIPLVRTLPLPHRSTRDGSVQRQVRHINNDRDGQNYLLRFGYLRPSNYGAKLRHSGAPMRNAIREFQRMANIQQTGVLDGQTLDMMNQPRCGMPDEEQTSRSKRYAVSGLRWRHTNLTYTISQFSHDLPAEDVRLQIAWALQYWAEVTPLTFYEKRYGPADIEITFRYGDHGDGSPFDYVGGLLAHAFYPPADGFSYELAGDVHFDDSETWTILSDEGTNLLYTAVHEFGHSLGLKHSDRPDAIMWPWVREYEPGVTLSYDDIYAIQTLYGGTARTDATAASKTTTTVSQTAPMTTTMSRATPTTTMTSSKQSITTTMPPGGSSSTERSRWEASTPPLTTTSHHCNDKLDAITQAVDGHTYIFQGSQIFRVNDVAVEPGFPRDLDDIFTSCPDHVTAALTFWPRRTSDRETLGGTYLFQGSQCWRYVLGESGGMVLHPDYPKSIHTVWMLNTSSVDAAFQWGRRGSLYFISGNQYWRHSGGRGPYLGYPRLQSSHDLLGWLPRIQAAFTANRNTYFFGESEYYKWTPLGRRGFFTGPRDTGRFWLGCHGGA